MSERNRPDYSRITRELAAAEHERVGRERLAKEVNVGLVMAAGKNGFDWPFPSLYPAPLDQRSVCFARYTTTTLDARGNPLLPGNFSFAREAPFTAPGAAVIPSLGRLDLFAETVAQTLRERGLKPFVGDEVEGAKRVPREARPAKVPPSIVRRASEGEIVGLRLRLAFGGKLLVVIETTQRGSPDYRGFATALADVDSRVVGVVRHIRAEGRVEARKQMLYGTDTATEKVLGFTIPVPWDAMEPLSTPSQREAELEWSVYAAWIALHEVETGATLEEAAKAAAKLHEEEARASGRSRAGDVGDAGDAGDGESEGASEGDSVGVTAPQPKAPANRLPTVLFSDDRGEAALAYTRRLGVVRVVSPGQREAVELAASLNRYVIDLDDRTAEESLAEYGEGRRALGAAVVECGERFGAGTLSAVRHAAPRVIITSASEAMGGEIIGSFRKSGYRLMMTGLFESSPVTHATRVAMVWRRQG